MCPLLPQAASLLLYDDLHQVQGIGSVDHWTMSLYYFEGRRSWGKVGSRRCRLYYHQLRCIGQTRKGNGCFVRKHEAVWALSQMQCEVLEAELDSPVYSKVSMLLKSVLITVRLPYNLDGEKSRGPEGAFFSRIIGSNLGHRKHQRQVFLGKFLLQLSPSKGRGVRYAISSQMRSIKDSRQT
jgi:hypothetical protein